MSYIFHGNEMRSLRKEDLSLYYYLKHVGLFEFIELEERAPLKKMDTEDCSVDFVVYEALVLWCESPDGFAPKPTERGRGWVYLDSGTVVSGTDQCSPYVVVSGTDMENTDYTTLNGGIPEQSDRITVSDVNDVLISDQDYMIDYLDGRIITLDGSVIPYYIDYYWNYVSLVDEWAAVEAADPPVVVIDMHGTDKAGYQLGGGKKQTRKVDLHIFATNPAERNDIVEELVDSLFNKTAPVYDFPLGTMLEYDGTWYGRKTTMNKLTSLFNRQHASHIIGNMEFLNVTSRHVSLPLVMTRDRNEVMLSDLNAYRSKVTFDLITYTYV
jgi:hypothetical protein